MAEYHGTVGDDVIQGSETSDYIYGGPEAGGEGRDKLYGLGGNDFLYGGVNSDQLYGGYGNDRLEGGDGSDSYYFSDSFGQDLVADYWTGGTSVIFQDIRVSQVIFERDDYDLFIRRIGVSDRVVVQNYFSNPEGFKIEFTDGPWRGPSPTNNGETIYGLPSSDTIDALGGDDMVFGRGGNDLIGGGDGNDYIYGEEGNDNLNGAKGDDEVYGGAGNDGVRAGLGRDLLFGGAGSDRFDFDAPADSALGATRDRIGDFVRGQDKIDLSTIDASASAGGNQAFAFKGTGALTGAGQVRASIVGNDTIIQGSVDADSAAEFEIVLTGRLMLASTDFLL